eukprot:CAMPEP_0185731530 /NCGR_PEP_ID=MMETSP1171-20130828/13188_1 /TAXON_ID=374046 /ORGANISM="Helicotheca tamensis, Strain CCMP826" /LENGTH=225 /DNA_ID=CAMNT_0028400813 /DNA_START=25 /DNA_END=702 /DNA_ORIENTATION=-
MAVNNGAKEKTPLLKSVKKESVVVVDPDDYDDDVDGTTKSCAVFCGDVFLLICVVSIIVNICMLLSQIWATMIFGSKNVEAALRAYVGCFDIVYIIVELEWMLDKEWITKFPLMANWIIRGIVFSFLGLIGMEQSIAIRVDMLHLDHVASTKLQAASLFLHIASYFMTCMGGFYFCMGVACMKEFRDTCRRIEKEEKEEKVAKRESLILERESLRKEVLKEENMA